MILHTLQHFMAAKWRWQVLQGERLERYQDQRAQQMVAWVAQHSPFYRQHWQGHDLRSWRSLPTVNKADMMAHFEAFNTLGLGRDEALQTAQRAEQDRNFSPTLAGATVGLSSGTSGSRGLFVVSPAEQAAWSGIIVARLLHRLQPEQVAFFLRANSNLYESVRRGRWLQFRYLDLLLPCEAVVEQLEAFVPTIVVAPPSMLAELAALKTAGKLRLNPRQVVSVAEVLEPQDRTYLESVFQLPVHQVYQATEGLLAISCAHGQLHIQEDLVAMQMEAVPDNPNLQTPLLTDLWRRTQPIVRYRLGDVLELQTGRCGCGSTWRVIAQHHGRLSDALRFEQAGQVRQLYLGDVREILLGSTVPFSDYLAEQDQVGHLRVFIEGSPQALPELRLYLEQAFARLGYGLAHLELCLGIPPRPTNIKRRRVIVRPPHA